MDEVTAILNEARALGLRVSDTTCRATAAGIGPYNDTLVGPETRSVTVAYPGETHLVADRDYASGFRSEPADPTVRDLGERLYAAARCHGVSLWWGSAAPGIGCHVLYTAPASARAARLAEDIRSARVRALEWPGGGHDARLAELTALVAAMEV